MWNFEVSRLTTAKSEQIWELWTDVSNWSTWDSEVSYSKIVGKFQVGSNGIIKPRVGPKSKFKIIECTAFKSFTSRGVLPLCKIDLIHTISNTETGLLITHKIVMTGLMTFLFAKVIGSKISASLPESVENLIKLAETNE